MKHLALLFCMLTPVAITAAEQPKPEYGLDITVDVAKKIAAKAVAECTANKWNVAVAIVNTHGSLVYYERMNDTQSASAQVSVDKASAAAMYRRTTRVFAETVAKSGPATMTLPGVIASPGGVPIVIGGKIVGGIGVSGVTGDQDEQCAKAGLAGL